MISSPYEARKFIVDELERRLVGPLAEDEVIPNRAYDTYHTGFLSPARTPVDEEEDDQDTGDSNSDNGADEAIMTLANLSQQSAMGMSFQVDPTDTAPIRLVASWAEYKSIERKREDNSSNTGSSEAECCVCKRRC